jgi:hypothetical protein
MKRIARESYTIVKESGVVKALRSTYRRGGSHKLRTRASFRILFLEVILRK